MARTAERFEEEGMAKVNALREASTGGTHRSATGLALAARGMLAQRDGTVIESLPGIGVPSLIVVGADDTPFLLSAEVMAAGLDVILGDAQVKSVFVNVFGGITACDAVANGIVGALEKLGAAASKPLVVRLDGNKVEEGRKILADANHPLVTLAETMDAGADKAAELASR